MVSVEDRRFRSHIGVDPIGIARAVCGAGRRAASWRQGDLDHHPAAGAQRVPQQQPHLRPQDPRGGAGAGARRRSSPRTRSSSSISTRSISAAAPMASIPPAASSSAIRRDELRAWPRRRSSPGWSRRRRRYSPTADVEAAVSRANVVLAADAGSNGAISAERGRDGRSLGGQARARGRARTRSAISPTGRCRSSTSCCPTTTEPIEVWTTLDLGHAARRDRRDQGQRARGRAGRAGQPRPRRRGAGDGRRHRLRHHRTTTARPRRCASRARRGSCSSISPRSRPATRPSDRVVDETGDDRRLEPAQFERRAMPAKSTCAPPSPIRRTPSRRSSATRSASARVASMARRFGITTPINTLPSMVLGIVRRAA